MEANLTLSFDHRGLDGGAAGRLLARIAAPRWRSRGSFDLYKVKSLKVKTGKALLHGHWGNWPQMARISRIEEQLLEAVYQVAF